jgi:predicted amidophosphoribosyltransferase
VAEKLPLWTNVRWFQLAWAALTAVLGYQLWEHATGRAVLSGAGLVWRVLALAAGLFVFLIYLQNVHRFGLVPDYAKKCWSCHGPVNRYSEFCEHCGADLISPEKLVPCPRCGVELFEGTPFCPECGAAVQRMAKGKRGKKKGKPQPALQEGWDEPADAVTGLPPPREDDG